MYQFSSQVYQNSLDYSPTIDKKISQKQPDKHIIKLHQELTQSICGIYTEINSLMKTSNTELLIHGR